jgi:hypothetical protein
MNRPIPHNPGQQFPPIDPVEIAKIMRDRRAIDSRFHGCPRIVAIEPAIPLWEIVFVAIVAGFIGFCLAAAL